MDTLIKLFFSFRYFSWIAVFGSILGSVLMFFVGAYKIIVAISYFGGFSRDISEEPIASHINLGNKAMSTLVSAMDIFLFALVLIIFAYGVYHLFIEREEAQSSSQLPQWARVHNIAELKSILAQVIIIVLFVDFLESVINAGLSWIPWEALVPPIAIVLLAGALRLMHENKQP